MRADTVNAQFQKIKIVPGGDDDTKHKAIISIDVVRVTYRSYSRGTISLDSSAYNQASG